MARICVKAPGIAWRASLQNAKLCSAAHCFCAAAAVVISGEVGFTRRRVVGSTLQHTGKPAISFGCCFGFVVFERRGERRSHGFTTLINFAGHGQDVAFQSLRPRDDIKAKFQTGHSSNFNLIPRLRREIVQAQQNSIADTFGDGHVFAGSQLETLRPLLQQIAIDQSLGELLDEKRHTLRLFTDRGG